MGKSRGDREEIYPIISFHLPNIRESICKNRSVRHTISSRRISPIFAISIPSPDRAYILRNGAGARRRRYLPCLGVGLYHTPVRDKIFSGSLSL